MKHVNRKIFLKTHTHTNTVAKLWLFQTTQKTNEAKRTNLAHRLSHTHTISLTHTTMELPMVRIGLILSF